MRHLLWYRARIALAVGVLLAALAFAAGAARSGGASEAVSWDDRPGAVNPKPGKGGRVSWDD